MLFSGLLLSIPFTIPSCLSLALPSELQLNSSGKEIFLVHISYFTDKDGKAQRGEVTCPGSHSKSVPKPEEEQLLVQYCSLCPMLFIIIIIFFSQKDSKDYIGKELPSMGFGVKTDMSLKPILTTDQLWFVGQVT